MPRRDYEGNAVPTTLVNTIGSTDLTLEINDASGWPTGGANGKFFVTLDRGTATEERILAQSRVGTVISIASVSDRGVDGTAAASHIGGSTFVEHTFSGIDADDANKHSNDATHDHHTQYMKADGSRHDLSARHAVGTVVPTAAPGATQIGDAASEGVAATGSRSDHKHSVAAGLPANVGVATGEGAAGTFARSDHAHILGSGVVDDATIELAANILRLKDAGITPAKLAANLSLVRSSASDPGAIGAGQVWWDSDDEEFYIRNPADNGWVQLSTKWARGELATPVKRFTNAGPVQGTETAVSGLEISLPASFPGSRNVRLALAFRGVTGSLANSVAGIRLDEGGTNLMEVQSPVGDSLAGPGGVVEVPIIPTAGAHTYRVTFLRISGSGDITLQASAIRPMSLTITDQGPTA